MRVLLFCLLLPFMAFAQEKDSLRTRQRAPFTLKTSVMNLLNPIHQSVDLLADIPLAPRWGVEVGIGRLFASTAFANYVDETYLGFKLKSAIKYSVLQSAENDTYISLAFKYQDVNNDHYVNTLRQGAQYTEWLLERKRRITWGAAIRIGAQFYLGNRKRFLLETFGGVGLRQLRISNIGLPPDVDVLNVWRIFTLHRPAGIYTLPDVMMGFNVGWAF
jgi:hypothetical protein